MFVYIALLAAFVFLGISICGKNCSKAGKAAYCVIAAVVFIFVSASRFEVSYDYNFYGRIYAGMNYSEVEDLMSLKLEKGFLIPLYALSLGFPEYYWVFIATSVVIYIALFALIYKNSSNPWISVASFLCLGAFFNSLCFLRQFTAALVVTYAIKYVTAKKPLQFFVMVLAASCFHWSALIMLGLYIFLRIKPGKVYLGIITALTVLFCMISKPMMKWFIENFYMYKTYDPETNVEASVGLSPIYTIIFGIVFLVFFLFRKRLIEKNPANAVYINCMMFDVVFEACGMRHAILSRFALIVFLPPLLYLVPDTVAVIKEYIAEKTGNGMKRTAVTVLSAAVTSVLAVGCYVMLILNDYNGVYPYVSMFDRPYDIFVEYKSTERDEDLDDYSDEDDFDEDDLDEEYDDSDYSDEADYGGETDEDSGVIDVDDIDW
ncbi:MAG: EpsG family protein [Oscillospiraceae bacterium]